MKTTMLVLLAALSVTTTAANAVTTDDVKWINQCVADNKGDASAAVVLKYGVEAVDEASARREVA